MHTAPSWERTRRNLTNSQKQARKKITPFQHAKASPAAMTSYKTSRIFSCSFCKLHASLKHYHLRK
ncbi:hypothetical protein HMPREF1326_01654 [Akkermansia sp. KLE1605]|nr:hypothetical protein HMPREF1326_01654 [Akkermansia sp. KLE1605]